ncbi:MAG: hypothetical protein II430_04080, partial [Selenomonas sp.]|nr:hypothetical protein [Selenomonas sp.]
MELQAGRRWQLTSEDSFLVLTAGQVEVYAVTRDERHYRQAYLLKIEAGQAIFPSMDEFGEMDILIYAVTDSSLTEKTFAGTAPQELQPLMQAWFMALGKISWLNRLAALGDDMLVLWPQGEMFPAGTASTQELLTEFKRHQQIFTMLQGMRFLSADKRLRRRQEIIARQKNWLVKNAISNLLGEDEIYYEESSTEQGGKAVEENIFILKLVMKALSMPEADISLSSDIAKKLDSLSLLRRLAQKANVQLRLVRLDEAGWHKNDTGVFIAYYGADKAIAALIPERPGLYKLVTRKNPQGIRLTAEQAAQLDKDAFICYAGFPRRKLKIMDLMRFMFQQCWKADYRAIILTSLIAGLIPLATPIITETIFQDIIPIFDRQGLATVTQALMVTSFTTAALSIVRSIAIMRISTKIEISSEAALWGRLLSMPTKFFRRYTVGELAGRMGGLGVAKGLVSGNFVGTVFSFIFSFWSIFLMCYYSLKLTAAAIAVWIVYAIFEFFVFRRVLEFQRKIIEASNKTAGTVQQIFAGLAKFRVQGAEEQAYHLWSRDFGTQWNYE